MHRILFAPNVRSPGAMTLLAELIGCGIEFDQLFLPKELTDSPIKPSLTAHYYHKGKRERLRAELDLVKSKPSHIFSFNNFPPLLKVAITARNMVYFHNVNILEFGLSKFILKSLSKDVTFIAQSPQVKSQLIKSGVCAASRVEIFPFYGGFMSQPDDQTKAEQPRKKSILYLTNANKERGNRFLIDTLSYADDELRNLINISVTLSEADLQRIPNHRNSSPMLRPLGHVPHFEVAKLMGYHDAILNVSKNESFGMDLLEARAFSRQIIAPDADFSQSFVIPDYTFTPGDKDSLLRCLRRFIGYTDYRGSLSVNPLKQRIEEFWKS